MPSRRATACDATLSHDVLYNAMSAQIVDRPRPRRYGLRGHASASRGGQCFDAGRVRRRGDPHAAAQRHRGSVFDRHDERLPFVHFVAPIGERAQQIGVRARRQRRGGQRINVDAVRRSGPDAHHRTVARQQRHDRVATVRPLGERHRRRFAVQQVADCSERRFRHVGPPPQLVAHRGASDEDPRRSGTARFVHVRHPPLRVVGVQRIEMDAHQFEVG